jgi:hypothetical protein
MLLRMFWYLNAFSKPELIHELYLGTRTAFVVSVLVLPREAWYNFYVDESILLEKIQKCFHGSNGNKIHITFIPGTSLKTKNPNETKQQPFLHQYDQDCDHSLFYVWTCGDNE